MYNVSWLIIGRFSTGDQLTSQNRRLPDGQDKRKAFFLSCGFSWCRLKLQIRKIYVFGFSLKTGAAFKKTGNYSGNFLRHSCKFSIINTLRGTGTEVTSLSV